MPDLEAYLDQICADLGLRSDEIRLELRQHIEQTAGKLEAAGHSSDRALSLAIQEFGPPEEIAAGLAATHGHGGAAMYRRVISPALVGVGILLGTQVINLGYSFLHRVRVDALQVGAVPSWLPPAMPRLDWLVFAGVFLAISLCAQRGGSRRECIAVGLAPLLMASLIYLPLLMLIAGLSAFPVALGILFPYNISLISLGTTIAVQEYASDLLSLAATCLAATWLYFFAATRFRESPFWAATES